MVNQQVVGSSPTGGTMDLSKLEVKRINTNAGPFLVDEFLMEGRQMILVKGRWITGGARMIMGFPWTSVACVEYASTED